MQEIINLSLLAFTSFFTLLNPIGTMPVFMTMTSSLSHEDRTRTAKKATIVAFITLMLFAFGGQLLFQFFGISVDSFRIVGGVIFFLMGMDMLQARLGRVKIKQSEVHKYVEDISITPLAIPMICGPGSITNAIVLMEDADSAIKQFVLVGTIAVVMLLVYLILYSSGKIIKILGETGNNVLTRLMGLIIMVIAVEFIFAGITPFLENLNFK